MAAPTSHPTQTPTPISPEFGIEAAEQRMSGETAQTHNYGVYVLRGTEHEDGSSGLVYTFNPDVMPMKDPDTKRIARNVRLALLPLKRQEQEQKAPDEDMPKDDLRFRVEGSEGPARVLKNNKIVDDDEEVMSVMFGDIEDDRIGDYTVMRSWPAVRIDYNTSLIDEASLTKAVGYIIASQTENSDENLWMEDMSTGANIESLIDPDSVKPGNPNEYVRQWIRQIIEAGKPLDAPDEEHIAKVGRAAEGVSSLLKAA
ncbi:MAG: hypothetical protein WD885_02620 [Candidatus Saccharimonadales bacterium]